MLKVIEKEAVLPFITCRVSAGFPSPADDYLEEEIDLLTYLVRKPAATFVMQVTGQSMTGAGIMNKDYVIVDKSITAKSGHIVVAVLSGEMTIKRLCIKNGCYSLQSENPAYPQLNLYEDNPPDIWGVVVGCIRRYG